VLNTLSKNILSTITYYDVLEYPLTSFEIWKYLIENQEIEKQDQENNNYIFSLAEVVAELEEKEIQKYIETYQGFYFLNGRKNLVAERIEKNKISESKLKKAQKIVFWLRAVPFVKMVAVAGRVGAKSASQGSDIDMLIMCKHGKIFTGRFLVTTMIQFLGRRRHNNKITNRFCLNHFLSDNGEIYICDLYSSHNYVFLTPLYGGENFGKFLEKNQWIGKYRPNFSFLENNAKEVRDSKFSAGVRKILEILFSATWIEKILKKWQSDKIKKNPLTQKKGGVILCSDIELSFWPDFQNQGPKVLEAFKQKASKPDLTKYEQSDNIIC
jgi:hypothetical protein